MWGGERTIHGIPSLAAYLNHLGIMMHADFDSLALEWCWGSRPRKLPVLPEFINPLGT